MADVYQTSFSMHFFMKIIAILIDFSLKILVQTMALCRSADRPMSESKMAEFTDAYIRHSASKS